MAVSGLLLTVVQDNPPTPLVESNCPFEPLVLGNKYSAPLKVVEAVIISPANVGVSVVPKLNEVLTVLVASVIKLEPLPIIK